MKSILMLLIGLLSVIAIGCDDEGSDNGADGDSDTGSSDGPDAGADTDSDTGSATGSDTGSDGDTGDVDDCPDISGQWTIVSHSCYSSTVGSTVTVSQSGCDIETFSPWPGWAGSLTSGGELTASGPGAGVTDMSCTGEASGTSMSMSCDPPCEIAFER